jgi:hypothetical protein
MKKSALAQWVAITMLALFAWEKAFPAELLQSVTDTTASAVVPLDSIKLSDSVTVKILGIKPRPISFAPFVLTHDTLRLKYSIREKHGYNTLPGVINLQEVMPKNRLFWDYRENSYYTPWYVQDKLARIMNRPTPGEVLPIWPVAMIAAKLALQRMEILKKVEIKPEDYLIPRSYWPILKALWQKAPQSAFDLYRIKEIQKERTLEVLKNDLQYLVDHKLIKPKQIPNAPTVYFPAQSRGKAIELLDSAIRNDRYSLKQKKQWMDLKQYILSE